MATLKVPFYIASEDGLKEWKREQQSTFSKSSDNASDVGTARANNSLEAEKYVEVSVEVFHPRNFVEDIAMVRHQGLDVDSYTDTAPKNILNEEATINIEQD